MKQTTNLPMPPVHPTTNPDEDFLQKMTLVYSFATTMCKSSNDHLKRNGKARMGL